MSDRTWLQPELPDGCDGRQMARALLVAKAPEMTANELAAAIADGDNAPGATASALTDWLNCHARKVLVMELALKRSF